MIQREQELVDLQLKIKRAEDEELKKKREHEKKVAEARALEEKKQIKRLQDLAEKVQIDSHINTIINNI